MPINSQTIEKYHEYLNNLTCVDGALNIIFLHIFFSYKMYLSNLKKRAKLIMLQEQQQ